MARVHICVIASVVASLHVHACMSSGCFLRMLCCVCCMFIPVARLQVKVFGSIEEAKEHLEVSCQYGHWAGGHTPGWSLFLAYADLQKRAGPRGGMWPPRLCSQQPLQASFVTGSEWLSRCSERSLACHNMAFTMLACHSE